MAAVAATGPVLPAPAATAGTTAPVAEDPQTTGGRQLQSKLRSWNQPQTTLLLSTTIYPILQARSF